MKRRHAALVLLIAGCLPTSIFAQRKIPPYDLWNSQVLGDIRNQGTLEPQISSLSNLLVKSYDVYFTSNPSAGYYDASPPYARHVGEKITIHGYLAIPFTAGPHPALVVGHGHGGQADLSSAQTIAFLYGYAVLAIDGPQAGKSTGGPRDNSQAWISVDEGPEFGFLYHYAYAGMRALTLLQFLANQPGNPYGIDAAKLGVFGASMGGIFTTYINGIDDRVKAAIIFASAGNWQHSLRDPNGWLYHGLYTGTRDLPYNGSDPLNSIENVDTDSTAITFFSYFDPIRYVARQYAPVLTVIGTHDGYFPLPEANLTLQAMTSAGAQPNFEKRLWLLPNAMHGLSTTSSSESISDPTSIVTPLLEWLKYCFGAREKPLATPQISMADTGSGLRFEVTLAETAARLANARVKINLATKIDSTVTPVQDFREYPASQQNDRYIVQLSKGEKSPSGDVLTVDNAIYFATATDGPGLQVSSLVFKGTLPIDLSTDFTPKIDQYPGDKVVAPTPPDYISPATTLASSIPLGEVDYQGMALTNPTSTPMAVRVEAWTPGGRLGTGEGLVNPVFMTLPGYSQRIFVAEEWFGPGARRFNGSLRMGWSDAHATALAFRGNAAPSQLEAIGPLNLNPTPLWLPLAPDQDAGANRRLRIFTAAGSGAADVKVTFRDNTGTAAATQTVSVPPSGTADVAFSQNPALSSAVSASIETTVTAAARLEVMGNRDPWSIEARPALPATRLIQPHVEWNGMFTTRLLMLNASAAAQTATFKLYRRDGSSPAADVTRTIPAGSVLNEQVESLFGIAPSTPAGAGWFEVRTGSPGILVTALAVDPKAGAAAASAPGAGAAGNWSMPFFVQNSGYWTGLALANPGDTPATVTITAYDPSGTVLGSVTPPILGAKQSVTQLISQWMPGLAGDATGQIIISTTAPVSLLAYFGTGDGASLAAIPFTPIAP